MARQKFTKEQTDFIRINYPIHGSIYCANILKIDAHKIYRKAERLKIYLTPEGKKETYSARYEKNFPQINHDVSGKLFSEWPDIWVYLLGFIWADGHLEKKSFRIRMTIQREDADHIINHIKNNEYLNFIKFRYINKRQETWKNMVCFSFSNKKIYNILKNLNYVEKSIKEPLILDILPPNKIPLWILGIFDGDGCISQSNKELQTNDHIYPAKISISGSYNFNWNKIIDILSLYDITHIRSAKITSDKGHKSSSLFIHKINDVVKFINLIYENKNIGLPRKYEKASHTASLRVKHIANRHLIVSENELADLRKQYLDKLYKRII